MGLLVGDIEHYLYRHDDTGLNLRLGDPDGSHIFGSLRHQESSFAIGCPSGALRLTVGNESTPETAVLCNNNGDVKLYYNNNLRLQTTDPGTYVTGSMFSSGSDIRLKENIVNITDAVSKIKQLQGFNYNFNSVGQDLGFSNKLDIGLSAQDVEKVVPEVLGKIPETDYLTVNYEKLVPLLIESIKELSTEVETLKTKVAALESA